MQDASQSYAKRSDLQKEVRDFPEPKISKSLLDPVDRISEILFGLIMALTFTCTISVADSGTMDVRAMLIAAIGCNIAWGLVDAVMSLLMKMTENGHNLRIFNFVRHTKNIQKAHMFIANALPPVIARVLEPDELEVIRQKLLKLQAVPTRVRLKVSDFRMALGIFMLVFLSTFPVAIPFILIEELNTALRTSNLVAIIMMFLCGWFLGKYSGRNKLIMGIAMCTIGTLLLLITISLGG